jgi:hypothetical protein
LAQGSRLYSIFLNDPLFVRLSATGIVTGTKVAIQNDADKAIVTARQQIRISIAHGVSHGSQ